MATVSSVDHFDVYKFHSSGLVALCEEVADLARRERIESRFNFGIDLDSAEYVNEDGLHIVRFRYKED